MMKKIAMSLSLATALLVGCGEEQHDDHHHTDTPAPAAETLTWHKDMKPLIDRTCVRCHSSAGVGPGDYSTYENVAPLARTLATYVEAKLMPPPAANPECHDYEWSERIWLSDEERELFGQWADAGAPEGDIKDAPEPLAYVDKLPEEEIDFVLRPQFAHKPSFDETGNEYHCNVVELDVNQDIYVDAFDVMLDQSKIVHHVVLYWDLGGNAGEASGDSNLKDGWRCGDFEDDWKVLAAWAPGAPPWIAPEGTGTKIKRGAQLVLETHYFNSDPGSTILEDRSGYAISLTEEVEKEITYMVFGTYDFVITPGDDNYVSHGSYTFDDTFAPMELWGFAPHMHLLGKESRAWIERADGNEECMLEGPYDFNNQLTYNFQDYEPIRAGDTLHWECVWDNSAANPNQPFHPPQEITWGEGTTDEMCFMFASLAYESKRPF